MALQVFSIVQDFKIHQDDEYPGSEGLPEFGGLCIGITSINPGLFAVRTPIPQENPCQI
jgi:hypothetical protein